MSDKISGEEVSKRVLHILQSGVIEMDLDGFDKKYLELTRMQVKMGEIHTLAFLALNTKSSKDRKKHLRGIRLLSDMTLK